MNNIKQFIYILLLVNVSYSYINKSIGISSGLSLYKLHNEMPQNEPEDIFEFRPMVFGECFFELTYNKYFSTQIGINYLSKGAIFDFYVAPGLSPESSFSVIFDNEIILDYIAIPVACKGRIPIKIIDLYGIAGVDINYLVNAKEIVIEHQITGNEDKVTGTMENQLTDNLKPIVFSVVVGTGVELNLKKISPFLEYVYTRDINDIWKKEYINDGRFWKNTKNIGMLVKVGIKITI